MNVNQLRDELAKSISALRTGVLDIKVAAEITNAAGKMIKSAQIECEYNAKMKLNRAIPFLEPSNEQ